MFFNKKRDDTASDKFYTTSLVAKQLEPANKLLTVSYETIISRGVVYHKASDCKYMNMEGINSEYIYFDTTRTAVMRHKPFKVLMMVFMNDLDYHINMPMMGVMYSRIQMNICTMLFNAQFNKQGVLELGDKEYLEFKTGRTITHGHIRAAEAAYHNKDAIRDSIEAIIKEAHERKIFST